MTRRRCCVNIAAKATSPKCSSASQNASTSTPAIKSTECSCQFPRSSKRRPFRLRVARRFRPTRTTSVVDHRFPPPSRRTPLHWAVTRGHKDVVRLLVAAGADATLTNAKGDVADLDNMGSDMG